MKYLLLILWVLFLATSCRTGGTVPDKPVISVSIIPQQYFIEKLAGDLAEVNVLVAPGASPATYEPSVSQLVKLEQSAVYMRIGYIGFEQSWMDKLSAVNPEMKLVDLSEGVVVIKDDSGPVKDQHRHSNEGHDHHGTDPHIWMSVRNAQIIIRNIHRELLLLFPEKKGYLENRLTQFSKSIDSLDRAISGRLESLENRKFMIYHPALTYYARDYGLEQISLEKGGKSPSPSHLKNLSDLALRDSIDKILIQTQFDSDNANILARDIGSEIIQFDPLDQNWSEQMYYIAEQLNPSL